MPRTLDCSYSSSSSHSSYHNLIRLHLATPAPHQTPMAPFVGSWVARSLTRWPARMLTLLSMFWSSSHQRLFIPPMCSYLYKIVTACDHFLLIQHLVFPPLYSSGDPFCLPLSAHPASTCPQLSTYPNFPRHYLACLRKNPLSLNRLPVHKK